MTVTGAVPTAAAVDVPSGGPAETFALRKLGAEAGRAADGPSTAQALTALGMLADGLGVDVDALQAAVAELQSGGSADVSGLTPDGVDALGQFELQPGWVMGHSWTASDNQTPGARWYQRVASRLRMTSITSKGVGSMASESIAFNTLAGQNRWVPRTKALFLGLCSINDVTLYSTDHARAVRGHRHSWRTIAACVTADAAIASNVDQFAYSPGWTKETIADARPPSSTVIKTSTGGARWKTTTVGSYFDFTFTGDGVDLILIAQTSGAGVATATVNGSTVATLDLTGTVPQECPAVLSVRGQGAGTHTVRVTLTSGSSLTVDSARIPTAAPVPGVVIGEPTLDWSDLNYVNDGPGLLAKLKQNLVDVVADQPTLAYADINEEGWNLHTMMNNARHPNDKGSATVAKAVLRAAKTLPYCPGLNQVADGTAQPDGQPHPAYPTAYVSPAVPSIPAGGNAGSAT